MCAIIGALAWGLRKNSLHHNNVNILKANALINHIIRQSHERGRDGRGYIVQQGQAIRLERDVKRATGADWEDVDFFNGTSNVASLICNLRAEPTTEHVPDKRMQDQQPYSSAAWSAVHNGTIANDKELRNYDVDTTIDSAAIVEFLSEDPLRTNTTFSAFLNCARAIKGSFAIIATNYHMNDRVFVAANYRPVWYVLTDFGIFFASSSEYFPPEMFPKMLEPYTASQFTYNVDEGLHIETRPLRKNTDKKSRALVVCSGGLDSVVSATYAQKVLGCEIVLLHFRYGSRAEGPEVRAIWEIANELGVGVWLRDMDIYDPADSPLLRPGAPIAESETGAEFAYEWVPARNLVMLAHATAIAEAKGFDFIVLGNNLEEAGAYPDNEPEFIAKFNALLPFAVGDGKRVQVVMPVGNLMKHEIVELGHTLGAPMHKTWSCYHAGELHCGKCGPCFMRKKAFEINNLPEVIKYEETV